MKSQPFSMLHFCRLQTLITLAVMLAGLVGCQPVSVSSSMREITTVAAAHPISTYTTASTYQKYRDTFPMIALPDMHVPASVQQPVTEFYKQTPSRSLGLDWFVPVKVNNKTVTVVLVHGGGWANGSKENMHALALRLAQRGVASVAVSYRLSGEAQYPAAIDDLKDAVIYVQQQAHTRGLNRNRVAIAGGSAGAQLAALVGVTGSHTLVTEQTSKILPLIAIVNLDGVMDFTEPEALVHENDPSKNPSAAGAWLGGRYGEIPQRWAEASPNKHLNGGTPPMLFLRSSMPRFSVGYVAAMQRLNEQGILAQEYLFVDAPHSFWLFDPWVSPTADAMVDFIGAAL